MERTPQERVGDAPPGLLRPGFAEEALPHLEAVHAFALRLVGGDGDDAADLVQDTFLRAYRAWDHYTPGTNCRAWLFTICKNGFLVQQRRRAARPIPVAIDANPEVEALASIAAFEEARRLDPELTFFSALIDREVLAALDALPVEFREAVVLSDLEDLSYAEIAEVLGVPVGTVKSRLYRGRRLLQQALFAYAAEMGHLPRAEPRRAHHRPPPAGR